MKLILISPPFGEKGQRSKGLPIAPPVLEYLAGLTKLVRPDIQVQLIDANKEHFDPEGADADLIGFTVLTPQAPWVYRTADALRAVGRQVILGGIHVTALPEEAKAHADAVVLGEAEKVWEQLLSDAERGTLNAVYHGEFPETCGKQNMYMDIFRHRGDVPSAAPFVLFISSLEARSGYGPSMKLSERSHRAEGGFSGGSMTISGA